MIENLTGKEVVVIANGITYRGILVEVGEQEVYLQAESGWITIPTEHVVDIREADS
jgi:hypothetical protein